MVGEKRSRDFPGGASGKEAAYKYRSLSWVRSLCWEGTLEAWQPTPVFLPGESHGQWSLASYNPWGEKELDPTKAT